MAGRPKGAWSEKRFKESLQAAVTEPGTGGLSRLRNIAEKLVVAAENGEGWAIGMVADRLDGRPAQAIIGGDEDDPAVRVINEVRHIIVDPKHPDGTGV